MEYKISVRNLIEFVLKSGDLDGFYLSNKRMLEGIEAHKEVQSDYLEGDLKEVFLKHRFNQNEYELEVSGRADGILKRENNLIIDEIKSTTESIDNIKEDMNSLYWAQVYFYGYFFCLEESLEEIKLQLTYINIESKRQKRFQRNIKINFLEKYIMEIVEKYFKWIINEASDLELRNKSIRDLEFPYENYRKYQREIAVITYKSIEKNENVFIEAATGIGKTLGTLFPAIKSLAYLDQDKIFYVTAKTITRQVVIDSMDKLIKSGLNIRAVILTAKDKICFLSERKCTTDKCKYMKGYYDKLNKVIRETFKNESLITREVVEKIAKKHAMCPFELSLDLSLFSDLIVGDYNYIFDPRVRLKRYEETNKSIVLLVDESHNLVNRGRDMFSAELYKEDFLSLNRLIKEDFSILSKKLLKVNKVFLNLKKDILENEDFFIDSFAPEMLYDKLVELTYFLEGWLNENSKNKYYEEVLQCYFDVIFYVKINDLMTDGSIFYYKKTDANNYLAKIFTMNPSKYLKNIKMSSKIFFSATLSPLSYYREILGGKEEDKIYRFTSPFSKGNRKFIFCKDVSTRYKDRSMMAPLISDYIKIYRENNPGNLLIFFPSYSYMNEVYDYFTSKNNYKVMIQENKMTELERENFIKKFNEDNKLLAFAVLGGIFSEGIDLKNKRLEGVAIIGIGLPRLSFENNLIKSYFDTINKDGFSYAYSFPSIFKIMQAAGRVIRSHKDKGTILLIGNRFLNSFYRNMLPEDWEKNKVNIRQLKEELIKFWKN